MATERTTNRGRARLLIITGAAVADPDELPAFVRSLIESASEILVVTPTLPSRLEWLASDTDRARHETDERLRAVAAHVELLLPKQPQPSPLVTRRLSARSPTQSAASARTTSCSRSAPPITARGRSAGSRTALSRHSIFRSWSSRSIDLGACPARLEYVLIARRALLAEPDLLEERDEVVHRFSSTIWPSDHFAPCRSRRRTTCRWAGFRRRQGRPSGRSSCR